MMSASVSDMLRVPRGRRSTGRLRRPRASHLRTRSSVPGACPTAHRGGWHDHRAGPWTSSARPSSPRRSPPSPRPSATRPGARSTCSPTSSADGRHRREVAERFDLHPNVARHHLDKLAAGGYLEVAVGRGPHGGAGRPSKRYRAARRRRSRSTSRSATTTCSSRCSAGPSPMLAADAGRGHGRGGRHRVRPHHGRRHGRPATHHGRSAPRCTPWPTPSRPTASPPTPSESGNRLRIVSEHCPFGDAAVEHPVICAVDRGMVKGMLGALYGETRVDLTSASAGGDRHCVTAFDDQA